MAPRDPSLKFVCPVCEAAPNERCHVKVGVICFESHWERRDLAMTGIAEGNWMAQPNAQSWPRRWQAS